METKTEQEPWPSPSTPEKIENFWTRKAFDSLVGRRILSVRYMTDAEARAFGWKHRPLVIELDNGERLCPALLDDTAQGDEIGEGGNLFYLNTDKMPLPWLDLED